MKSPKSYMTNISVYKHRQITCLQYIYIILNFDTIISNVHYILPHSLQVTYVIQMKE